MIYLFEEILTQKKKYYNGTSTSNKYRLAKYQCRYCIHLKLKTGHISY